MARYKVSYHIDELAFERQVRDKTRENQQMFDDDLREPLRQAARAVIYGNFMGTGAYNPRAIGEFTSTRARYYRGWVETNYGSQRAYLAGGKRAERVSEKQSFDHLRNAALLDAVSQRGEKNPSLKAIASEARRAKLSSTDPLRNKEAAGFDNLRGYLSCGVGTILTRKATKQAERQQRQPILPKAGKMKYGVQTGKLARAWRDLTVTNSNPRQLNMQLNPTMGNEAGTPNALKLTEYLSRNKGWRGLMDHNQLVDALKDQGVIVVNGRD